MAEPGFWEEQYDHSLSNKEAKSEARSGVQIRPEHGMDTWPSEL